jgi:hypothetical protein
MFRGIILFKIKKLSYAWGNRFFVIIGEVLDNLYQVISDLAVKIIPTPQKPVFVSCTSIPLS